MRRRHMSNRNFVKRMELFYKNKNIQNLRNEKKNIRGKNTAKKERAKNSSSQFNRCGDEIFQKKLNKNDFNSIFRVFF